MLLDYLKTRIYLMLFAVMVISCECSIKIMLLHEKRQVCFIFRPSLRRQNEKSEKLNILFETNIEDFSFISNIELKLRNKFSYRIFG